MGKYSLNRYIESMAVEPQHSFELNRVRFFTLHATKIVDIMTCTLKTPNQSYLSTHTLTGTDFWGLVFTKYEVHGKIPTLGQNRNAALTYSIFAAISFRIVSF
jgi:hypothetical protein